MSEILENRSIKIREDYVDATERCALMAEKLFRNEEIDPFELEKKIQRWRQLRKKVLKK